MLNIERDEWINAVITVEDFVDDWYLLFTTRNGITKRTTLSQFANIRRGGLIALGLREDDELISVKLTDGQKDIMIGTKMVISSGLTKIKSVQWAVQLQV